jgi:hypothetical protein
VLKFTENLPQQQMFTNPKCIEKLSRQSSQKVTKNICIDIFLKQLIEVEKGGGILG